MKRHLSVQTVLWSYRQSFHLLLLLLHTMFSILYFWSVVATRRVLLQMINKTIRGFAANRTVETTFLTSTPTAPTTTGEALEENLWDLFGEHAFRWLPGEPWDIRLRDSDQSRSTRQAISTARAPPSTTHRTTKAELDFLENLEKTEAMCAGLTNLATISLLGASLFLVLWFLRSYPPRARAAAAARSRTSCLLSLCAGAGGRRKGSRASGGEAAGGVPASASASTASSALAAKSVRARRSCMRMGLRETSFYMEIVLACLLAFALLTAAALCLLRQDPEVRTRLYLPAAIAVSLTVVLVGVIVEISTVFFVRPGHAQRPSQIT